jgi:hypothetical protein
MPISDIALMLQYTHSAGPCPEREREKMRVDVEIRVRLLLGLMWFVYYSIHKQHAGQEKIRVRVWDFPFSQRVVECESGCVFTYSHIIGGNPESCDAFFRYTILNSQNFPNFDQSEGRFWGERGGGLRIEFVTQTHQIVVIVCSIVVVHVLNYTAEPQSNVRTKRIRIFFFSRVVVSDYKQNETVGPLK